MAQLPDLMIFLEVDDGPIISGETVPMTTGPCPTFTARPRPETWDEEKVAEWFSDNQLEG